MTEIILNELSESMQMYLVTITRLRENDSPVPLSVLADNLSISPVSVNEMCRKLQEQGLVTYQPYKGATLTSEGNQQACYILRRHRLWEVFLVNKLGFDCDQSHDMACKLEHATSQNLADQLDYYLEYPPANPEGKLIPRCNFQKPERKLEALASISAGQRVRVVRCDLDGARLAFLEEQAIRPGAWMNVIAVSKDSHLMQVGQEHISVASTMAEGILVEVMSSSKKSPKNSESNSTQIEEELSMQIKEESTTRAISLSSLKKGEKGIVVQVKGKGAIKRRMMDMGVVPGSEISVVRVAPFGDPIEFMVKGYNLSLRKSEARDIKVEKV